MIWRKYSNMFFFQLNIYFILISRPLLHARYHFAESFLNKEIELDFNSMLMAQSSLSPSFLQKAYTEYVDKNSPLVRLKSMRIKKRFTDWKQKVIIYF